MITEARRFGEGQGRPSRIGVAAGPGPVPAWKLAADTLYAQVAWSLEPLLQWRASFDFPGRVFAGVMVVPSAPMARKLSADVPQLAVPGDVVAAVERDPAADVERACALVEAVRASGAFDGVHLIPVTRYREVAARLDPRPT